MIGIDIVYGVMNGVIKVVIDEGTNRLVYLTYQQLVAALFVAPVAYFVERETRSLEKSLPTSSSVPCLGNLWAMLINYFFLMGLQYTSAAFACASLNMTRGIMGSGVGFLVMSWCVENRGPVFAAAFSPLIQITVADIGVSILHEQLFLGSILGSILVALAFTSFCRERARMFVIPR